MEERIYQKIGRIKEYLNLIRSIKDECMIRFKTDPIYRGALLHYLYLLADSCLSLAEIVIKHKGLRRPQSYHDVIDILGENKILDSEFAFEFAKIAGFRNFLAHDYEKIEAEIICEKTISSLKEIDSFIKQIEASLQASDLSGFQT